ncbi:MAG: CrcB protein [Candidatus Azotimanducaceae bacterium]|jgi:CrcB protein|tara:strand:- start:16343 stop:16699 length:357 start_codon:yes stop_codon:yes gene_type:complete
MSFFYVALGGALGACARYGLSLWLGTGLLPWATLLTNIAGSFIIGLVWGLCAGEEWFQSWGRLLIVVGLLGGFTTFSAFSLESIQMLEGDRLLTLLSYLVSTLSGCLLAVWLGLRISQ